MSIFEYDKEEEERKLRKAEREVGREEGAIAGELKKAKEVAEVLVKKGLPVEEIVQIVGYDEAEVQKWIG